MYMWIVQPAENISSQRSTLSCNKFISLIFFFIFLSIRNPTPDHWALVTGLPTYVAESGFVST